MVSVYQKFVVNALLAGLMLCGCQSSQSSIQIRVPLDRQYVVNEQADRPIKVSLPGDQPFNIHIKQSSQNRGADGRAESKSDADAAGQAFGFAEVNKGGSAAAEFTIGHRIANQTENPQDLAIELDFQWVQSLHTSAEPEAKTLARAELAISVISAKGKTLATIQVLKTDSNQARASAELQDHRGFSVSLEPKMHYDIVLTGKVEARSAAGQEAEARLEVKNLGINLSFTSASQETTRAGP